ncbi:MAG: phospho-sugar mutase [Nitrospirae bacterium]|nr:phospho-sugar mutase [Nitrospirota bacterium]
MEVDIIKTAGFWATDTVFDPATRQEIQALLDADDEAQLKDRFYRSLDFGTGGLRGVMGAGTNRMNLYTVRIATAGLANYVLGLAGSSGRGICIAYDTRLNSATFARETASVLAAMGIKTYIYDDARPVPQLSFTVRHVGAMAGVCITASHNPPEYNGYKVYFEDGGQITPPHDAGIINEVRKITDIKAIPTMPFDSGVKRGLIEIISDDGPYLAEVMKQSIVPIVDNLKIVYTPLHGSGRLIVPKALSTMGFTHIIPVTGQMEPDGNFSTVRSPNPEEHESFTMALKYATDNDADIAIATDPDCDRFGVAVKKGDRGYVLLNGNQVGVLLVDYILTSLYGMGKLGGRPGKATNCAVVKTIVTTDLVRAICDGFGVECIDLLTGFKYIGEWIKKNPDREFLFGCEESYGYLRGTYARDKDAVLAAVLVCEMASYYKTAGTSLYGRLIDIYGKYGFYSESLKSVTMKGIDGAKKIETLMASYRDGHMRPEGFEVLDYQSGLKGLPPSNVVSFVAADGSRATVRPSGTEPKIKYYFSAKGKSLDEAQGRLKELEERFAFHESN